MDAINAAIAVRNIHRHLQHVDLFDGDDWRRDVMGRDAVRRFLRDGGRLPTAEQSLLDEADAVFEAHAAVAWREMKRSGYDLDADPDAYWHRLRKLVEKGDS